MQESKDCLLDCLVVELPIGFGLTREKPAMPAIFERPKVLSVGCLVDPKKAAHCAAAQPTMARENGHGSVTVGQAAVVEAIKQGRHIGDIANLPAKRIGADPLLKDGAHPLERGPTGLLARVRLRGDADHPTGVAEKLLCAASRDDRWISTR